MTTRNSTQAAFAQPESSWSRKRSLRIVIRIQIQTTKKKISRARRSASHRSMSASSMTTSCRFSRRPVRPPSAYAISADDDLAVHEGMDLAVVAEGPPLFEAHGGRVARLDAAGVEDPPVGRGMRDARRVGEDDPGALRDLQRAGVELEVVDDDRLGTARGRGAGRRGGRPGAGEEERPRGRGCDQGGGSPAAAQVPPNRLHRPCLRSYGRQGSKPLREEHRSDRPGYVEAGDSLAHRDAEPRVGALEQPGAQPVALGAEGEDGARR